MSEPREKQKTTKTGENDEEGDERITDKRAGKQLTVCHSTVASHNLLCSGP